MIESAPMTQFELQPHLIGELVEARPLRPEAWQALYAVAADPLIWEQHPASDRYQEEVFRQFFQAALESGGAFTVIDHATGNVIGSTRYCGFDPLRSEIEIGWTFLARSHWGGKYNGELKRLMLEHAFKFVDTVIFHIGATNTRSRKAIERLGALLTDRTEERNIQGSAIQHVIYEIHKPRSVESKTLAAE